MSESSTHIDLVRSLIVWTYEQASSLNSAVVYSDLPETPAFDKPPCILGFYPDMYCESLSGSPIFIGEAKTPEDLERKRSREQIAAYLRFLASREGGTLVVAVPWQAVPSARSLIKAILRINSIAAVDVRYLEMLPG